MKSIIFSTKMIEAIFYKNKTQTRRIMKPQPIFDPAGQTFTRPRKTIYAIGDVIWVRETFRRALDEKIRQIDYKAQIPDTLFGLKSNNNYEIDLIKWSRWIPSIHMPENIARLFLRVVDLKAERIQDISTENAKSEGFENKEQFCAYWDELYSLGVYSWDQNPWVWIVEFKLIDPPETT